MVSRKLGNGVLAIYPAACSGGQTLSAACRTLSAQSLVRCRESLSVGGETVPPAPLLVIARLRTDSFIRTVFGWRPTWVTPAGGDPAEAIQARHRALAVATLERVRRALGAGVPLLALSTAGRCGVQRDLEARASCVHRCGRRCYGLGACRGLRTPYGSIDITASSTGLAWRWSTA